MTSDIVIVDYGSGNTRSMLNAVRRISGSRVLLTGDPDVIAGAERLILPGVGAFAACMKKLEDAQLNEPLLAAVKAGTPLLGVCVGMQVLADEGREFETTAGLGVIGGIVRRIELPQG